MSQKQRTMDSKSEAQQAMSLLSSWRSDIAEITDDVRALVQGDTYFQRSMEVVESSGRPANPIYQWLLATYGRDVAVSLRRVIDRDTRTRSLIRLLGDISRNSQVLSRQKFVERYTESFPSNPSRSSPANVIFTRLIGGDDKHLPKAGVHKDIERLTNGVVDSGIKSLVDECIAHSNAGDREIVSVKWSQVHDAVKLVEKVCWKYRFLLEQVELEAGRVWRPEPDLDRWLREFWLGPKD